VGGGAIGVAAAATSHSPSSASNAGYSTRLHHAKKHHVSQAQLLAAAQKSGHWTRHHGHWTWTTNWNQAFANLMQMNTTRSLTTIMNGRTQMAIQTGTVRWVDPAGHFVVLQSQNSNRWTVWWTNGQTAVADVTNNVAGVNALTASTSVTNQVMNRNNQVALFQALASLNAAKAATTPTTTSTTITIQAGNGVTITITVTGANAKVATNNTTTGTAPQTTTQSIFTNVAGLKAGDVALIAGVRTRGALVAQRVLFFIPVTTTPTTTPTPTAPATTPAATTSPTTAPTPTTSPSPSPSPVASSTTTSGT
jgi:hypothetical protein